MLLLFSSWSIGYGMYVKAIAELSWLCNRSILISLRNNNLWTYSALFSQLIRFKHCSHGVIDCPRATIYYWVPTDLSAHIYLEICTIREQQRTVSETGTSGFCSKLLQTSIRIQLTFETMLIITNEALEQSLSQQYAVWFTSYVGIWTKKDTKLLFDVFSSVQCHFLKALDVCRINVTAQRVDESVSESTDGC